MQKGSSCENVNFQKLQKKKHEWKNTEMPFFRIAIYLNHCVTLWKLPEPIGARLDGDMIV